MNFWIAVTDAHYIRIHSSLDCASNEISGRPKGPYCCMPNAIAEARRIRNSLPIFKIVACRKEKYPDTSELYSHTLKVFE